MCVCVFGMERRGRACAAQSCRILDFSLPVSAVARRDYGILRGRRAPGWHAKPGPDRGAGLRSTLAPRDLPLLVSSHPPPRAELRLHAPRGTASQRASARTAPFGGRGSFPHLPAEWGCSWGRRKGVGVGYFSPVLNSREPASGLATSPAERALFCKRKCEEREVLTVP